MNDHSYLHIVLIHLAAINMAWLEMKVWHHKTLHKGGNRDIDNIVGGYQFKYGVPAIIIVQLALIVYFIISKTI